MARADPSPHQDFVDSALSDVSTSPRSLGAPATATAAASVQRSGSINDDAPPSSGSRGWEDGNVLTRVKLMCSYGGRILPRPHDNQLRYVGGESRIVVVNRNVSFAELTAKLSRMFGSAVLVKYQLPCEDLDALISVTSDEDLENMMEEYDRLQAAGGSRGSSSSSRLRVFLFPAIERSPTSSLSDILDSSHSRERWFVDALNGVPLPRVRSETSSILSETPDYLLQTNIEGLEEWARAASYGNSGGPPPEVFSEKNYKETVSHAALFGSLLQHSGSNEISSAPGSPSPLKTGKSSFSGSSSSAPPAVMSYISAIAEAASRGQSQQAGPDIDGNLMAVLLKRGSADSSEHGGFADQKRYGLGEISPSSDKTRSSTGTGDETKSHIDEGCIVHQKVMTNGCSEHHNEGRPNVYYGYETSSSTDFSKEIPSAYGLGIQESKTDSSKGSGAPSVFGLGLSEITSDVSKGSGASKGTPEIDIQMVQPIYDEEPSPPVVQMMTQNVKGMMLDDRDLSSSSAQHLAAIAPPGQPVVSSNIGTSAVPSNANGHDRLKQQVLPMVSNVVMVKAAGEERIMAASSNLSAKSSTEEKHVQQQVPSTFSQVSPAVAVSQAMVQPTPKPVVPKRAVVEDPLLQNAAQSSTFAKESDKVHQVPQTSTSTQSLPQPVVHKPAGLPNVYQIHPPQPSLVETTSVTTYATQGPTVQIPVTSQAQPVIAGLSTTQTHVAAFKQNAVSYGPNIVPPNRVPISRSQSPPKVTTPASGFQPQQVNRVKTATPPSSVPPNSTTGPAPVEAAKIVPPMFTSMGPCPVFPSAGEGDKVIPPVVHQQMEASHFQRQMSDPLPVQRVGTSAQPASSNNNNKEYHHYMPITPGGPPPQTATGVPSRFRAAVGRPVQQVQEGFPNPVPMGIVSDKKPNVPPHRMGPSSLRPQVVSNAPYGYYVVSDQSNTSTTMGVMPIYMPSNAMIGMTANSSEYVGANPFVDDFSQISSYQDVPEVSTTEQIQRRQMWP